MKHPYICVIQDLTCSDYIGRPWIWVGRKLREMLRKFKIYSAAVVRGKAKFESGDF